jgi:signal transduction histidine kinase
MANFLIDSHLTSEQLDQVNVIRASTEGLRDLINDILDLSKVEAGMITLDYKWLHIRSIIEEVNDLTSSLALDKGVELNYHVHPDVPSLIKGDKFRFRQVLLNVIGNAIKFTQEGEVFIRCTLMDGGQSSTPNTAMLRFEVIDTGMGFNEKEAEKLFKRFSQIDASSTRQHGGTGKSFQHSI